MKIRRAHRNKKGVVSVIGGAGHVGLPFCLVLANNGFTVYGVDINEASNKTIMEGKMPFVEELGEEYLANALENGTLVMTTDASLIKESDVVVFTLGTPIDRSLNPRMSELTESIKENSEYFTEGQLIVLRSTLYPGTTEIMRRVIEKRNGCLLGKDSFLVCAPERITQGKGITECQVLPQLIGAFDDQGYAMAERFFACFCKGKCFRLRPIEAELGKLFTNMYRYVQFALANEFYLIADTYGASIHSIIEACNYEYPRMDVPVPGPNVGGPCLYKDGWFLLERFPFNEIISAAFRINEGMTMQIVSKLEQLPHIEKVSILGMTFKAGSDDTRNSLSFKLKNQLERNGYLVTAVDPYLEDYEDMTRIEDSGAVVLMTPHMQFKDLKSIIELVSNDDCLFVDIWGFWDEMKHKSRNGFFLAKEAKTLESSRVR